MNKKEVISKLKGTLTVEDKINIVNYWLKNDSPSMVCTFEGSPTEHWLKDKQIKTAKDIRMLEYAITKIKEFYGVSPKTNLSLMHVMMGFS